VETEEVTMGGRNVSPLLRGVLEYGPLVAFFAAYFALRGQSFVIGGREYEGFILATAGFVPLLIATTAITWRLTGAINRMQVLTVVLVVVFGGLTVALNDERFFKMKPTIIYALFALILGVGLTRGKSWLQPLMGTMLPLTAEGWRVLTRRLALFFAALAVANEAVWRLMSTEAWVWFKTFGLTAALFGFFIAQAGLLRRHGRDDDEAG
jgi:intracellular septation protein